MLTVSPTARWFVRTAVVVTVLGAAAPLSAAESEDVSGADADCGAGSVGDLPDWIASPTRCDGDNPDGSSTDEANDRKSVSSQICGPASRTSAAALRLCYKAAGVPASIVPALAAKVRALRISRQIVASAGATSGANTGVVVPERGPNSVPIAQIPKLPGHSKPDASCSASQPENCRPLPPVPPQLNLEAPAVPPNLRSGSVETPPHPERDELAARHVQRIRPSDGYDSPPDRPPRR